MILRVLFLLICSSMLSSIGISQELKYKEKRGKYAFFLDQKKITSYKYEEIKKLYEGGYIVKYKSKWGLLDTNGKESISCKYDLLSNQGREAYICSIAGKYGVINKVDSILLEPIYEEIDHYSPKMPSALVKQDGKWGMLERGVMSYEEEKMIFKRPDKLPLYEKCDIVDANYKALKACADKKMLQYVYRNIKYPEAAIKNEIEGTVVISFTVTKEGEVIDERIVREIGDGCGGEALRVVKSMTNYWIPGTKDGKNVNLQFNLPIKYRLK